MHLATPTKYITIDHDPLVAAKPFALYLTQSARRDFFRQISTCILIETSIMPTDQIWTRSCRSADKRVQRRTKVLTDTTERPLTLFPVHQQGFCYANLYQALRPLCTTGLKQRDPDDPIRFVTSVASRKLTSKQGCVGY